MGPITTSSKGLTISCNCSKEARNDDKKQTLETTDDEIKDMQFKSYNKVNLKMIENSSMFKPSTENSSMMFKPSTNASLLRSQYHHDLNHSNFLEHISEISKSQYSDSNH